MSAEPVGQEKSIQNMRELTEDLLPSVGDLKNFFFFKHRTHEHTPPAQKQTLQNKTEVHKRTGIAETKWLYTQSCSHTLCGFLTSSLLESLSRPLRAKGRSPMVGWMNLASEMSAATSSRPSLRIFQFLSPILDTMSDVILSLQKTLLLGLNMHSRGLYITVEKVQKQIES